MSIEKLVQKDRVMQEGREAAFASIIDKCPYPEGSFDRTFWLGGFMMGSQVAYQAHGEQEEAGEAEDADNTDA